MNDMTKSTSSGFIFMGIMVAGFAAMIQVGAAEITVDAGGGGDYTLIQDALDAAQPGDVITVNETTYYEHLNPPPEKVIANSG